MGSARLVPESPDYYADADYVWPLLGNLATDYPVEAARLAVEHVVPIECGAATYVPEEKRISPCQCLP